MKLLLDTHTLLWFVLGDSQLSATARQLIEDTANTRLVSPAAYWEIAIKISIGRYALHEPYETFMDRAIRQNGFLILPIEPRHTALLTNLPFHHRDPFDRLMIAQAIVEGLTVVSADAVFDAYSIQRMWQLASALICNSLSPCFQKCNQRPLVFGRKIKPNLIQSYFLHPG